MPMANQAASPFGSPMPGANFGGTQQSVPSPAGSQTPAVGGAQNPFLPPIPGGATSPGISSPWTSDQGNAILNPWFTLSANGGSNAESLTKGLGRAGYPPGVAASLVSFLQSGAGFNPDVAKALIASLMPQQQQAEAKMMEQFGHMGMAQSSPAAYGMAQLEGQFQLDYGQIFSQMYEQAVSNYMQVLLGGKRNTAPPLSNSQTFGNIAQGVGAILGGLGQNKINLPGQQQQQVPGAP